MEKILYSMCWEDYNLVLEGLKIAKQDSILCIASAGENLFSIALKEPHKIIGIDNNSAQINLVKLKIAAIQALTFEEFIKFLGFSRCNYRKNIFKKCAPLLDSKTKNFWMRNMRLIRKGIINSGKFENYLKIFRNSLLKISLSKKKIDEYLSLGSLKDQRRFYENEWNTFIWRISFQIFFSKTLMQILGRKKDFFKYNNKQKLARHFFKRVEDGLTKISVRNNPFIHYMLTGTIPTPQRNHPYLDKDNFKKLKKVVSKIKLIERDVFTYLNSIKRNSFNKYCLSDVFEGMSQERYEKILEQIAEKSTKDSVLCYWNNLANRSSHPNVKEFEKDKESQKLFSQDRVFFYSDFIVEKSVKK